MITKEAMPVGTAFTYKFNPGFQTDAEAIDNFVVRKAELDKILESIRANSDLARNQNVLITAPRGAGKTTLVRRVLAEARTKSDLVEHWYPIFLGEESYTVTTPGEFFLECLFHLQDHLRDPKWRKIYQETESQRDEAALASAALSALRRYACEQHKRLLLIVENVHMILNEQIGRDSDALRTMLDEDGTFMMLATSVRDFRDEGSEDRQTTFLRDYHGIHLQPLELQECQQLWEALTHQDVKQERIRPLQILTGGSPRLLRIMAEFAVTPSLQNLLENLNSLIDQNTEYFKSQLDGLPPTERKVFAALLDIWDPSTAKQVSENARVNVNIASAMLGRLADRGSVVKLPGRGRTATYHAAERLFNIYYLMRRRSHPSSRVRALVAFMTQYYRGDELIDTTAKLVAEACSLHPLRRQEYHSTFNAIIAHSSGEVRRRILSQTPDDFLSLIQDSEEFRSAVAAIQRDGLSATESARRQQDEAARAKPISRRTKRISALIKKVRTALDEKNLLHAEELLQEAIASNPADGRLWLELAFVLREERPESDELLHAAQRATELLPNDSVAYAVLAVTLFYREAAPSEIEEHLRTALRLDPRNILALSTFGDVRHAQGELVEALDYYRRTWAEAPDLEFALCDVISIIGTHLRKYTEAEALLREALAIHPEWQRARNHLAENLVAQERLKDAKVTLREGIEVDRTSPARWANLGRFLFIRLHELEEARDAFEEAIRLDEKRPSVWISYANVLKQLGKPAEVAINAARRAVDVEPASADNWLALGELYGDYGEVAEAEKAFEKAVSLGNSPRSWFEFGMFLQELPGRLPEAESALRRAVTTPERYPCMVPKELAALLIHKGDDENARALLKEAVEINKDCYCSLTLLAAVESREHRTTEAKEYFERALKVNPRGITAMTGLAQLVLEEDSRSAQAEELIDRALTTNSQDPRVFLARALLKRSRRADEDSAVDLRRALEIDPEFVEAKVILAMVEANQGRAEAAISHLTDAMRSLGRRRELLSGLVDAAVALAHQGHIDLVARAIREANALEYLEPLDVALQLLKGEAPLVAKEVEEVAADIVRRVREEKRTDLPLRTGRI